MPSPPHVTLTDTQWVSLEKKDAKLYKNAKYPEKICSVCEGHLVSINFPRRDLMPTTPQGWEGNYA
jgi:hypothetical protein